MQLSRNGKWIGLSFVVLFYGLVAGPTSWGQKPPPPPPPNPLAPVLAMPFPMGMQPGSTLEITLTGSNLAGPTGLAVGFPCKVTFPTDNKNGLDNAKLRVRLEVPGNAPPGYHGLRLASTRGMSNLRLFCIDDLPQVLEQPSNRNKATPQTVPIPCVLAGHIDAEQANYLKITVKAGQRLTFDLLGRRLGGPLDPELYLYGPVAGAPARTMRELAHQNDSPGCQTDPRFTYTFKEAGDYLLEIKDVLNRGGADYPYRLRIGDFPNATVPIPLAAKRGTQVKVAFAGPMVEGVAAVQVAIPQDPLVDTLWLAPKGANGLHGWPVALSLSDLDELVEQEPNDDPARAQRLPLPCGVTGRFQKSNDLDCYRFTAKKGQKILIQADTLEMYSPTLVFMVLKNAKGAEVARSNPDAAPPADQRIEFTPAADGDFVLEVQHLNFFGGPSEVYRISITPSTADFDLAVGLDRFDLAPGSPLPLTVLATRKGYAGPIDVSLTGHAGITGSAQIPAGQTSVLLLATTKGDLPMGPYQVMVTGKASINGKAVVRLASVRTAVTQSLSNLHLPPRNLFHGIALAIREKAPFSLAAQWARTEAYPGSNDKLTIVAKRNPGFDDVITLDSIIGLPPNVPAPKIPPIPKGKNDVTVAVSLNAKAPLGEYQIVVGGKAKHQKKDYQANSAPARLQLTSPFVIKVEPAALKLTPGAKAKLKVSAQRKGGYQGPIALEVRKLPGGVSAGKGTIAMGQNAVDLEVTAAANAPLAVKKDVDVLGTATAAGNLQKASPPFTITIGKK